MKGVTFEIARENLRRSASKYSQVWFGYALGKGRRQGVFVRWESILAQREWNETLAVTKTKFRRRMAGEGFVRYILIVFVWFDCFIKSICDGLTCE